MALAHGIEVRILAREPKQPPPIKEKQYVLFLLGLYTGKACGYEEEDVEYGYGIQRY